MRNALQQIRGIDDTIPGDVVGVVVLVALFDGFVFRQPTTLPVLRAVIGLGIVLFVPGYLLLAVLYPRERTRTERDDPVRSARTPEPLRRLAHGDRPSWTERIALSVGLSLAIIPLLGLLVTPVSGSLDTESVLLGLNSFVLLSAVLALVRRNMVPPDQRLQVPHRTVAYSLRSHVDRGGTLGRVLAVLFLLGALAGLATMGYAFLAPSNGEAYTSVSLLTENADGELVASGYPTTIEKGGPETMSLRVANNEGAEVTYTAVAVIQRVDTSGEAVRVTEEETLLQRQSTVPAGESWLASHTIEPQMTGGDLRLQYQIYRGEPPAEPSVDTAYRTLRLWVSVPSES